MKSTIYIVKTGEEVPLSGLWTLITGHLMVMVVPLLCLLKGPLDKVHGMVPAVMFILMKSMAMAYMMDHLLVVVGK